MFTISTRYLQSFARLKTFANELKVQLTDGKVISFEVLKNIDMYTW